MGTIVSTFVIKGNPVASSQVNRITMRGGNAGLYKSKEYKAWFKSAVEQLIELMEVNGHHIEKIPVLIKTGKNAGKTGKNQHQFSWNPDNHLFHNDRYRIVIWYLRPTKIKVKNKDGSPKMKNKGTEFVYRVSEGLDTDNVSKGTIDALQQAGVIDNDRYVRMACVVELPILKDGDDAFVAVEVKTWEDSAEDWIIPRPPAHIVDPSLYMPRVMKASDWHKYKKEERDFQESRGDMPQPVTKARCACCTQNIGHGWYVNEIWWIKKGDTLVKVCGRCGLDEAKRVITPHLDRASMLVCRDRGVIFDSVPTPHHPHYAMFVSNRNLAERKLHKEFRDKHVLVSAEEIESVGWLEIDSRFECKKEEILGTDNHRPSTDRNDRHSTQGNEPPAARPFRGGSYPSSREPVRGGIYDESSARRAALTRSYRQNRGLWAPSTVGHSCIAESSDPTI